MSAPDDCSENFDPLKLVREGTSQDGRLSVALDPAHAPVSEHGVTHGIVFAQSYAALLKYFDAADTAVGNWVPFFGSDVSVTLAVAAIEDVDTYKANTLAWFDYLNNLENKDEVEELKNQLGYLYASIGTLARALDGLKAALPPGHALKATLKNLIRSQLAPAFERLIAYHKGGTPALINPVAPTPAVQILRRPVVSFTSILSDGLSQDWSKDAAWAGYVAGIDPEPSVYGDPAATVFVRINHGTTHNLFRSIFDQFLKVFARIVIDAEKALGETLTRWDKHDPHYALYLAFLRLLEFARTSANTLTKRHLDFYYREILGLKERGAQPGHVHLFAELGKQVASHRFKAGKLFKAGKDDQGRDAFFANEADVIANRAKVAALRTVYRHGVETVGSSTAHEGRLYASPAADSDDGLGAPLTTIDQSWHPFHNKIYSEGTLTDIRMPKADIGFAVASHYLLLAGGARTLYVWLPVTGPIDTSVDWKDDFRCLLTTEKGWLEKQPDYFGPFFGSPLILALELTGDDPPIVPYSAKVHGYTFQTDLPVLQVRLKHDDARPYAYSGLKDLTITTAALVVAVENLKSMAVANDFGPVDPSKPFQPFGSSPVKGSSLVVGSKEVFQKTFNYLAIDLPWLIEPTPYPSTAVLPTVSVDVLHEGQWAETDNAGQGLKAADFLLSDDVGIGKAVVDEPDFAPNEFYGVQSRHGFARLRLSGDLGQSTYQADMLKFLRKEANATFPGPPPVGPTASAISIEYEASSILALDTAASDQYENRPGQFFHITPFGTAEQHPYLNGGGKIFLLPQFAFDRENATVASEAEFYIGIADLAPPQNLSLLLQVVDGTANPLAPKPERHISWSYLRSNQWTAFDQSSVQDGTAELLKSGIITFAIPREATKHDTLLQDGLFWIRAAVHDNSDAVCRLQLVAAQAMQAAFADQGNSPTFSATPLPPGTITKLVVPDPAVKSISQPFASFGGRGVEQSQSFFTRISERLRHKDRSIALWDYEHLILEAFPEIFKVKCLNHTQYETGESFAYRELAPGHVTIVTVPRLQGQRRDPLKPYTSLGVLQEIKEFLRKRASCFARLHVKNPIFEEVRTRFELRLRNGFDETYYTNQLKQAITRFLSPWAFVDGGAPSFGGKIYKSVLINFVEEQPYVDYVANFELFHDLSEQEGIVDLNEVEGAKAVSILVSVPASKHEITVIKPAAEAELAESCGCDA